MLRRSFSSHMLRNVKTIAFAPRRQLSVINERCSSTQSSGGINNWRPLNTTRHISMKSAQFAAAPSSKKQSSNVLDIAPELDDFMTVFPEVVQDVTMAVKRYDQTTAADASTWLQKAILYNVPKGKRNRGLLTVSTYKLLQQTNETKDLGKWIKIE